MKTFTLRGPEGIAERLCSSRMRSWLEDFIRYPHALPPDPGSGYERISLTLPKEVVEAAASLCGSSVSSTLRRISAERLPSQVKDCHGASDAPSSSSSFAPLFGLFFVLGTLLLMLWVQFRFSRKERERLEKT